MAKMKVDGKERTASAEVKLPVPEGSEEIRIEVELNAGEYVLDPTSTKRAFFGPGRVVMLHHGRRGGKTLLGDETTALRSYL